MQGDMKEPPDAEQRCSAYYMLQRWLLFERPDAQMVWNDSLPPWVNCRVAVKSLHLTAPINQKFYFPLTS